MSNNSVRPQFVPEVLDRCYRLARKLAHKEFDVHFTTLSGESGEATHVTVFFENKSTFGLRDDVIKALESGEGKTVIQAMSDAGFQWRPFPSRPGEQ